MSNNLSDRINWRRFTRLFQFCLVIAFLFIFLGIFFKSILFAIIFSIVFTYLVRKPFQFIDRYTFGPRKLKAFLVVVFVVILISLIVSYLFPLIYFQVVEIIKRLPIAYEFIISKIEPIKNGIASLGYFDVKTLDSFIEGFNIFEHVSSQIKGAFNKLMTSTPTLMEGILNLALIPVFTFFAIANFPALNGFMGKLIPEDLHRSVKRLRRRVDKTLMAVIQGQVTVAMILSVLYMSGFYFISLRYAIAIGAIAGICRIVPYLDVIVGTSLSMVVIISHQTQGVEQVVGVGLVFLVVQLIDGMIITPRVIGDSTGLHPAIVIGSIFAFGDWLGFFGVLIAVPFMAILKSVLECLWPYYLKSPYYFGSSFIDKES